MQAIHLQLCAVACMAELRKATDKCYLVGVTGLQSGGKSTLTEHLVDCKVSFKSLLVFMCIAVAEDPARYAMSKKMGFPC